MIGVTPLPCGENRPHGVKLAMLAQQVAIAENVWLNVPDAHEVNVTVVASEHSDWAGKGVAAEKTGLRIGKHDKAYGDEVSETTITYSVTGVDGGPLELTVGPHELVSVEIPEEGSTWRIAYDPSKPGEVVLLEP